MHRAIALIASDAPGPCAFHGLSGLLGVPGGKEINPALSLDRVEALHFHGTHAILIHIEEAEIKIQNGNAIPATREKMLLECLGFCECSI
nr:hypothetical protein [Microvirga vignae]